MQRGKLLATPATPATPLTNGDPLTDGRDVTDSARAVSERTL